MAATILPNANKAGGQRVFNGLFPNDLPKAFLCRVDLTASGNFPWIIDLSEEQDRAQIPFIQSCFIDNSLNNQILVLTTDLGQVISCPPNGQGFFPILASANPRFSVATANGLAGSNNQTNIFFLSAPMPIDVWSTSLTSGLWTPSSAVVGSYTVGASTATIAAGTGAGTIFAFRYAPSVVGANPSTLALVRKIIITAGNLVGFTPGFLNFALSIARAFTVSDSGGTALNLTGNAGKLRTSFPSCNVADFRIATTGNLTPGTRTLDAVSAAVAAISVTATAGQPITPSPITLFQQNIGEQPLQLANNEGFEIIQAVPATGTWDFGVQVQWDEVASY